ncbi:MAG: hypothetical protein M0R18_15460 [Deltaproteobacteria bacterium]|jgi:hypothetical protein|nr:hypothetical protein [Deltaproteobacteria bacterium]MDX9761323.1 hypothetical protein [Desulfomonilia bacterium]
MRRTELRKVTILVIAVLVSIAVFMAIFRGSAGDSRGASAEPGTLVCGENARQSSQVIRVNGSCAGVLLFHHHEKCAAHE